MKPGYEEFGEVEVQGEENRVMKNGGSKEGVTVSLDSNLLGATKIFCARRELSVSQVVTWALRHYLYLHDDTDGCWEDYLNRNNML